MRKALIGFKRAIPEQLCRQRPSGYVWNDLIVFAVHYEHGYGNLLEVFGEIRLGEGDDAVVVGLGASHYALAPPIQDHRLRALGARAVVTIERPRRDIVIELRSAGSELRLK